MSRTAKEMADHIQKRFNDPEYDLILEGLDLYASEQVAVIEHQRDKCLSDIEKLESEIIRLEEVNFEKAIKAKVQELRAQLAKYKRVYELAKDVAWAMQNPTQCNLMKKEYDLRAEFEFTATLDEGGK